MADNALKNMIALKSSDKEEFIITEAEAKVSKTISRMIEDDCAQSIIPLPNVIAKILAKVIEYCKKHVSGEDGADSRTESSETPATKDMDNWDREFLDVDQETFFGLLLAANYLEIKGLLDLTCKNVADQIKAKSTPEEIRRHFHIVNDYTPEEEAEVRRENNWAFED